MKLSAGYEAEFQAAVAAIGSDPNLPAATTAAIFWPLVGHRFDGDLLVVGRAVNGWVHDITVEDARIPSAVCDRVAEARKHAERDEMRWVTDLAGNRDGYNTNESAFWRVNRRVVMASGLTDESEASWSARIAWSNLYKLAPVGGGNPRGAFLRGQTEQATRLLAREISELDPQRILVLAGRWWFEPFADRLGLDVEWRTGLVEGTAKIGRRRYVIAQHPMTKPEGRLVQEVLDAFGSISD